jgi:hypothetical protein
MATEGSRTCLPRTLRTASPLTHVPEGLDCAPELGLMSCRRLTLGDWLPASSAAPCVFWMSATRGSNASARLPVGPGGMKHVEAARTWRTGCH